MWSRASHTIRRIKKNWAELDYAQRRLFEIQTGLPITPEGERARARADSHELEVLFARQHPEEQVTSAPASSAPASSAPASSAPASSAPASSAPASLAQV